MANKEDNSNITPHVFLCVWTSAMYKSIWQNDMTMHGIGGIVVTRFSEIPNMTKHYGCGASSVTHLLIDGNIINKPFRSVYNDLAKYFHNVHVTVVVPSNSKYFNTRKEFHSNLKLVDSDVVNSFASFNLSPAESFDIYSYLHGIGVTFKIDEAHKFICVLNNYPEDFDKLGQDDNKLSQMISKELSTISASIHLDPKLLRLAYVPTEGIADSFSSASLKGMPLADDEFGTAIDAWLRQKRKNDNYAKEIFYHSAIDTDSVNQHKHFSIHHSLSEYLDVVNRRTYLLVGAKGSGKTTFIHYYRLFYAPTRQIIVVDFLPYSIVADAKQLFLSLEKELFELLKEFAPPELLKEYDTYYAFRAENGSNAVAELLEKVSEHCPKKLRLELFRDWLNDALFDCSKEDLLHTWRSCAESHDQLNNDEDKCIEHAQKWRANICANPTFELISFLASKYYNTWIVEPKKYLAQKILEDAVWLTTLSGKMYSKREEKLKNALENTARNYSVSLADLPYCSKDIVNIAKEFLGKLGTAESPTIVFVDNMDRSGASLSELEIFKTAWHFLFDQGGKTKMVYSVRQVTYERHKMCFVKTDQYFSKLQNSTQINRTSNDELSGTSQYASETTNIAKITIRPPKFTDLLRSRFIGVARRLDISHYPSHIHETYKDLVECILNDRFLNNLFIKLFEGDFRINLELLESAIRSHHIGKSNLLYRWEQREHISPKKKGVKLKVPTHLFLRALMLGNFDSFRQERAGTVFLNMYNANLLDSQGIPAEWNTLLLHRVLSYIESHASNTLPSIKESVSHALTVPEYDVESCIVKLGEYGLISTDRGAWDYVQTIGDIVINPTGEYYLETLMWGLEYIQNVYWELYIDSDLSFGRFPLLGTKGLAGLQPFVDKFVKFLSREEFRESTRNLNNPAYSAFVSNVFPNHNSSALSNTVRKKAGGAVMSIYLAERKRP